MLHEMQHSVDCSPDQLRDAIMIAEEYGLATTSARQRYADLAKQERQSPEKAQDMLRWATSVQDGVLLYAVVEEVAASSPESSDLETARQHLAEHQQTMRDRLQVFARTRDAVGLGNLLDRARHMGIPPSELSWAEEELRSLQHVRTASLQATAPSSPLSTSRNHLTEK